MDAEDGVLTRGLGYQKTRPRKFRGGFAIFKNGIDV